MIPTPDKKRLTPTYLSKTTKKIFYISPRKEGIVCLFLFCFFCFFCFFLFFFIYLLCLLGHFCFLLSSSINLFKKKLCTEHLRLLIHYLYTDQLSSNNSLKCPLNFFFFFFFLLNHPI